MCSRFEGDISPEIVANRFGVLIPDGWRASPEIRPTGQALVVTRAGAAELRGFGIPAPWDGKPLINARAETLAEKPTFRPYLENRCLVLASAWFEWRAVAGEKRKRRNRIARADAGLIAFAGLTDGRDPGTFTIVTCPPAPAIAHIHSRMPVVLENDAAARWLDPDQPFEAVAEVLRPAEIEYATVEETPPPPRQGSLL